MAGQLDSLFANVAKQVVADLGASLDSTITYTKKASGTLKKVDRFIYIQYWCGSDG